MNYVNLIVTVYLAIQLASSSLLSESSCDVHINSSIAGQKYGNFSSANYPSQYPANLRCIYRLTGLPHERVRVEFRDFEIKGVPPRCLNDYIDVYTQVFDSSQDLLDVPLHGRYCGSGLDHLPKILISMHNVFILGFYSDHQKEEKGFAVDFFFIDNSIYNVGTPAPWNTCGQTIKGMSRPSGFIYSPTYPGVYPDNVFCFYQLMGVQRQRIRLTFEEIDLYSGGDHCPFDYIKVYDGPSNKSEVVETYCGHRTNLTVYSSSYNLYVEFVTKSGRIEPTKRAYVPPWDGTRTEEAPIQRRGFKASYEISAHFVDLSFIKDGNHVRGTECDQMVLSKNESSGYVASPNHPNSYPLGVVCTYSIFGLEDKQNLEKAKLVFERLNVPNADEKNCSNGYLSAYLRGQTDQPDHVICGSSNVPPLVSSNPRLFLVFSSLNSKSSGTGFKARFQFLTDYAIPGTPATEASKCHFIYRSSSALSGTFNSPRHPSNYPDEAACLYEFSGLESEQVRITFETFKLENSAQTMSCNGDRVQIYNVFQAPQRIHPSHFPSHNSNLHSSALPYINPSTDLLTGIYCGEVLPGPQLSEEEATSVKVLFITNGEGVNAGFKAKYEFIEKKARNKRCFYNITSGSGGQIWSPNYPHKYLINSTCEWLIISRHHGGKVLLKFNFFSMEKNQDKQGCGNAVLKIYSRDTWWATHEHCGVTAEGTTILSEANSLRLRFVSSARAIGAKGFKLTWTEVLSVDGNDCQGFRCAVTGYCISSSLKCNKMLNCGKNDNSDETADCGHTYQDSSILQISIAIVGTSMCLIVVIIACFSCRRRKSLARKNKTDTEVRQSATRNPSTCSSIPVCKPSHAYVGLLDGKIIKEQTEKVSIV